jgi:hypothetical protein
MKAPDDAGKIIFVRIQCQDAVSIALDLNRFGILKKAAAYQGAP